MEDGAFTASDEGAPQGGLVSPVLSKIDGKRVRKKLALVSERLRGLRAQGGRAMVAYLIRHLCGHIQYWGVSGNSRGVSGG